jgi:glycosyltransferase involved in cell wall biosynthesis
MDHNAQGQGHGRRHFHRGRRGPDRRGQDRRAPQQPPPEHGSRGDVDVEQIMRDIRARIAQRQGIELTNQQIQELAARRLEAILDPRSINPALLDQLRRATGLPAETTPPPPTPPYSFEDTTLFDSHRGLMRFVRKLLNPILKLFFNPNPLIRALNIQARLNAEALAREAERDRRQAEWNALHYELLQKVVLEISRTSIEAQALTGRIESLAAKVDFNERRVRGLEGTLHHSRPAPRRDASDVAPVIAAAVPESAAPETSGAAPTAATDGTKRRRRRRRGRRGGAAPGELTGAGVDAAAAEADIDALDGTGATRRRPARTTPAAGHQRPTKTCWLRKRWPSRTRRFPHPNRRCRSARRRPNESSTMSSRSQPRRRRQTRRFPPRRPTARSRPSASRPSGDRRRGPPRPTASASAPASARSPPCHGPSAGTMNLAVIVQRYGPEIGGGAELHARYLAERLARYARVTVLTTCARDYLTWRNEFVAGHSEMNGVRVERYPVARERDLVDFARRSSLVFHERHSLQDELAWLESEGPVSPGLMARVARGREFDWMIFFSARYYHAYHGTRLVPARAVLVPTAEREPAMGLGVFAPMFRGVRAIMYNSAEERALIDGLAGNGAVPGVVVGVGSDVPGDVMPERARQKFSLRDPFVLYVGRIDANKGCGELFDFFLRYTRSRPSPLDLVLIGAPVLPIPAHPRIRHLGYVTDRDKFDAIAAAAVLVMPSFYESLSMAALEAWALGRPVLANARCDVLVGQCLRSNAGLYYGNAAEFGAALDALLDRPGLADALGANGRRYYAVNYDWSVIERKYLDMFERLSTEPGTPRLEPQPGWIARRRRRCPPAVDVLAAIPSGPVRHGGGA